MMNYYQGQKPKKESKVLNTGVVLYLGELPPDVDQYELHKFITSHGNFNVDSLIVKPTKENKSYAYVKLKSKSEVEKARKVLHMKTLRDYVIKAEPFKQKEETQVVNTSEENRNLFVKNLPSNTKPKDLYELFIKYGNIISIKLKQNINGECLGYGYVNYEDSKSAESALVNLNDMDYNGKRLQVSHLYPKKERTVEETEKFPLVLIKQIPETINSESKLEEIFSRFGQISFCGIISGNDNKINNITLLEKSELSSSGLRIGVVLFSNKEDASSAVKSLDQTVVDESGVPFALSLAPINQETLDKLWKAKQESYKKKYEGCNLVIKNIPKEITEKNLFEIFKQYGDIAGARIATEGKMKEIKNENGEVLDKVFLYESKGYGFVLFRNIEDASAAKQALNNEKFNFKNIPLILIVEYYDYTKANNRDIINLNQMSNKPNEKKGYKKKFNNNYRKNVDDNSHMNLDQGQHMIVNNRTIINPRQYPDKKPFNTQQNPNMMQNNPNANQNNPYLMNNQQLYVQQQLQKMQINQNRGNTAINPNINQNTNNPNVNLLNRTPENIELVNKIKQIIAIPNVEERKELLGETIFYFLLRFIATYNLNQTFGKFSDDVLCSKLTGIFLHTDEKELVNIISNMEILLLTIKDVINQILQAAK